MNTLTLNSHAKLNLYLKVLNKRKDNYHNIKTLFERISLADKITLKSRRDKNITLVCRPHLRGVPEGPSNLACRAAKLLQDTFGVDKGVDIKIIKRIPVGSGMGGGSSDAASVLVGLNKLWKLGLTRDKLTRLGGKIGCDVPFFIYNSPFALGEGRGDKIRPLRALANARLWHILIVPKIAVSTPLIYKKWDEKKEKAGLTMPEYDVNILILALIPSAKSPVFRPGIGICGMDFVSGREPRTSVRGAPQKMKFSLLGRALFNSLQEVTAQLYPQISAIRKKLIQLGVKSILMSGSGPAVFGIVSSRKEALALKRHLESNGSWRIFVTCTE